MLTGSSPRQKNLRRGLEEIDKGLSGRLRIGAIPTALPIVSQITGPFYARFPAVAITVLSLNSQEIERGIEEFELEAGLTYLDAEPIDRVKAKPVCVEEYVFLTPVGGALADRTEVSWRQAAAAPLCLLTPDMQNRRIIDGIFRSVGEKPVPAVETNSIFNLVSHVSAGRWSAIVPKQLLRFFGVPNGTRPIELVEPRAHRTIGLVMSDREPPSPLARNLVHDAMASRHSCPHRAAPISGAIEISYRCFETFHLPLLLERRKIPYAFRRT